MLHWILKTILCNILDKHKWNYKNTSEKWIKFKSDKKVCRYCGCCHRIDLLDEGMWKKVDWDKTHNQLQYIVETTKRSLLINHVSDLYDLKKYNYIHSFEFCDLDSILEKSTKVKLKVYLPKFKWYVFDIWITLGKEGYRSSIIYEVSQEDDLDSLIDGKINL